MFRIISSTPTPVRTRTTRRWIRALAACMGLGACAQGASYALEARAARVPRQLIAQEPREEMPAPTSVATVLARTARRREAVDPCPFFVDATQNPAELELFRGVLPTQTIRVTYGNVPPTGGPAGLCIEQEFDSTTARINVSGGTVVTPRHIVRVNASGRPRWEATFDVDFMAGLDSVKAEIDASTTQGYETLRSAHQVQVHAVPSHDVRVFAGVNPVALASGASAQLEFWVRNVGRLSSTIALSCTADAGGACSGVYPSLPTIAPNDSLRVLAYVQAPGDGQLVTTVTARAQKSQPFWYDPAATHTLDIAVPPLTSVSLDQAGAGRQERSLCPIVGAGPAAAVQCGDLLVSHALPAYRSRNKPRGLTLLYNSATADPRPVVVVDHKTLQGQAASHFTVDVARITANGDVPLVTRHFDAAGADSSQLRMRRFVLPVDAVATGLGTGAYPVRVQVTRYWNGGSEVTPSITGHVLVVDRRHSPWGAGWWPAGIERLYPGQQDGHALLVRADGSSLLFQKVGTSFQAPAGEHSRLDAGRRGEFVRTLPGGTVTVTYTAAGVVRQVVQRAVSPTATTYLWSASARDGFRLDTIVDAAGVRTAFAYDAATGRVASIQAPAMAAVTLEHAGSGTQPLRLTGIVDPDAHRTSYAYDPATLRMTSSDARGTDAHAYAYDELGRMASMTPPAGGRTRHYQSWQRAGAPSAAAPGTSTSTLATSALVDTVGFSTWTSFSRGVTGDGESRATFRVHRSGAPSLIALRGGNSTQIVRDSVGQPTFVRTMSGAHVEQAWDSAGNLVRTIQRVKGTWREPDLVRWDTTRYEYHPTLHLVTRIIPPIAAESVTYAYDAEGHQRSATDGRGNMTRFTYTADGLPDSILAPATLPVVYAYHAATRNVTSVSQGARVTTYAYDSTRQFLDLVSSTNGASTSRVEYDTVKRVKRQTTGTEDIRFSYDDVARTVTRLDARNRATVFTADEQGRMVQECRSSGCLRSTWSGDVALSSARDGGFATTMEYDVTGRLTRRLNRDDDVTFGHDAHGNVTAVVNKSAAVYRKFDAYGRLTCEQQLVRHRADSSRLSGTAVWHDYDRMGRRLRTFVGTGRSCNVRQTMLPDHEGVDPLDPDTWAEMPPAGLPGGTQAALSDSIRYTYDEAGNLRTLAHVPWGKGYTGSTTWTWTYDVANRATNLASPRPAIHATTTGFDSYGDLATYAVTGQYPWTASVDSRDPAGRVEGRQTSSDGTLRYEYDAADRLKLERRNGVDALVHYDAMGNITRKGLDSLTYGDGILGQGIIDDGRLLRQENVASGIMTRYAYDAIGNQTRAGPSHGTAVSFGYLSAAGDRLNTYDASDRMVESRAAVSGDDPRCSTPWHEERRLYRYDGLGRRVAEESFSECASDHGITRYFWADDHVIAKVRNFFPFNANGSDSTTADLFWPMVGRVGQWMVYGPGMDNVLGVWNGVDGVHWAGIQGSTRYLLMQDDRGSVIASRCVESGPQCSPPSNGGYTAFGKATSPSAGAGNLPGFNGQQATGGLVYMRNRWYDPNTGRFTQEDPIGYAGGSNLYAYAGNDPVNYSDPFGLKVCLAGDVKQAQEALSDATDTDFKLDKKGCVDEGSIEARGNKGFGGLQGRFRAMARDTEKSFTLKLTTSADAFYSGGRNGGLALVGEDVVGRVYAKPGARCVATENPTLGQVVAHELLGHGFGLAYGTNPDVAGGQTQAIVQENRYSAARPGRSLRDTNCGD